MFNMKEEYDQIIAKHYDAYRPPLHALILEKYLSGEKQFTNALDVGCGTGKSSLALVPYCKKIRGIDPSKDMLARTEKHKKITYHHFDGIQLVFPDKTFDLVTFAGSLDYAKSRRLLEDLLRMMQTNSMLLIYDFEVLLDEIYTKLKMNKPQSEISYNHRVDFVDLIEAQDDIELYLKEESQVSFSINPIQLSHLILSSPDIYFQFPEEYKYEDIYQELSTKNQNLDIGKLSANIFCTKYMLNT